MQGGDEKGLGYTYGPAAIAALIDTELRPIVHGSNGIAPVYTNAHLCRQLRNAGHPGIAMSAARAGVLVAGAAVVAGGVLVLRER